MMIVNLIGLAAIGLIAWWFWFYKPRRISGDHRRWRGVHTGPSGRSRQSADLADVFTQRCVAVCGGGDDSVTRRQRNPAPQ